DIACRLGGPLLALRTHLRAQALDFKLDSRFEVVEVNLWLREAPAVRGQPLNQEPGAAVRLPKRIPQAFQLPEADRRPAVKNLQHHAILHRTGRPRGACVLSRPARIRYRVSGSG